MPDVRDGQELIKTAAPTPVRLPAPPWQLPAKVPPPHPHWTLLWSPPPQSPSWRGLDLLEKQRYPVRDL
jgi:hypothetical protein